MNKIFLEDIFIEHVMPKIVAAPPMMSAATTNEELGEDGERYFNEIIKPLEINLRHVSVDDKYSKFDFIFEDNYRIEIKTVDCYSEYYPVKEFHKDTVPNDLTICFKRDFDGNLHYADCIFTDEAIRLYEKTAETFNDKYCHLVKAGKVWESKKILDPVTYDRYFVNIKNHKLRKV